MPDEVSRGLGMEGGGFPVWVKDPDTGEKKEWILSDLCLTLQARHVAWIKGRRRAEKQAQLEEQVINQAQYKEELAYLDDLFAMGEYSFGKKHWQVCVATDEGAAKLFQLLLEKEQPYVKNWSLEEVQELVSLNAEGFTAALNDILPKALGKRTKKETEPATPSSKSRRSSRSSRTTSASRK